MPLGSILVVANGRVFPFLMAASCQVLSGFALGERAAHELTPALHRSVRGPALTYEIRDMQMMTCWRRSHRSHTWVSLQLPLHPSSHFADVKTLGLSSLKAQFEFTHTEKSESQDLLLTDPRTGEGEGEDPTVLGEGQPSSQVTRGQDMEGRGVNTYCFKGGW